MTGEDGDVRPGERKWACRGVRGATTAAENTADAILAATRELLFIMVRANGIQPADVASAIFTTSRDLNATYPALAARQFGWYDAALLCGHEMDVPGGLQKCIRILIHWNTDRRAEEIVHAYLHGARDLRPDRSQLPPIPLAEIEAAVRAAGAELETYLDSDGEEASISK